MFSLVSARYERASMIVTSNKPFSGVGRNIRRRGHRRGDDRPARPSRRDPLPQRRQLQAQGQGSRTAGVTAGLPHPPRSACFARLRPSLRRRPIRLQGVNFQPAGKGQFSAGLDSRCGSRPLSMSAAAAHRYRSAPARRGRSHPTWPLFRTRPPRVSQLCDCKRSRRAGDCRISRSQWRPSA